MYALQVCLAIILICHFCSAARSPRNSYYENGYNNFENGYRADGANFASPGEINAHFQYLPPAPSIKEMEILKMNNDEEGEEEEQHYDDDDGEGYSYRKPTNGLSLPLDKSETANENNEEATPSNQNSALKSNRCEPCTCPCAAEGKSINENKISPKVNGRNRRSPPPPRNSRKLVIDPSSGPVKISTLQFQVKRKS